MARNPQWALAATLRHSGSSETPFAITAMDIALAEIGGVPVAGKNGYTSPQCVHCPEPNYSDEAFQAKIQGEIILDAVIGTDGRAHNIIVPKGLGYGLDEQAIKTARDVWRFKPALGPDGKPAAVRMLVDIDFRLY